MNDVDELWDNCGKMADGSETIEPSEFSDDVAVGGRGGREAKKSG